MDAEPPHDAGTIEGITVSRPTATNVPSSTAPVGEAVFTATDLNVYYGKDRAVRDADRGLHQNEIQSCIGPPGCGRVFRS